MSRVLWLWPWVNEYPKQAKLVTESTTGLTVGIYINPMNYESSKMQIGFSHTLLAPNYVRRHKIDGIGVYTQSLFEALRQQSCSVIPFNFKTPRTLFQFQSQTQALPLLSAVLPRNFYLHKRMEKQIDIFHSTDYLIPRLKNTPVVATLHDAIMLKSPELASQRLRSLKNYLLKRSAHWADHIITISQAMVEDIVEYWGIPETKISVVHNGIDSIWHEKIPPIVRQTELAKFNITKPFILSVGTLQPRKNIQRLIRAYRMLPESMHKEYQLVIVGRAGWSMDDILPQLRTLQTSGKGIWLDHVGFHDLRMLYQAASLFAFPSLSEGFGLPVLEAFASGTATLAANTTSIPEIAGDSAYLVDPYKVDAIRDGLKKLLEDTSLREAYVAKGYQRVKDFSWERAAKKIRAIYQRLL